MGALKKKERVSFLQCAFALLDDKIGIERIVRGIHRNKRGVFKDGALIDFSWTDNQERLYESTTHTKEGMRSATNLVLDTMPMVRHGYISAAS